MRTRDLAKAAATTEAVRRERERYARRLRLAERDTRRGRRVEDPHTIRAYLHQIEK